MATLARKKIMTIFLLGLAVVAAMVASAAAAQVMIYNPEKLEVDVVLVGTDGGSTLVTKVLTNVVTVDLLSPEQDIQIKGQHVVDMHVYDGDVLVILCGDGDGDGKSFTVLILPRIKKPSPPPSLPPPPMNAPLPSPPPGGAS